MGILLFFLGSVVGLWLSFHIRIFSGLLLLLCLTLLVVSVAGFWLALRSPTYSCSYSMGTFFGPFLMELLLPEVSALRGGEIYSMVWLVGSLSIAVFAFVAMWVDGINREPRKLARSGLGVE